MNAQDKSAATQISIRQIHPFRNHPFKVLDDDQEIEFAKFIIRYRRLMIQIFLLWFHVRYYVRKICVLDMNLKYGTI